MTFAGRHDGPHHQQQQQEEDFCRHGHNRHNYGLLFSHPHNGHDHIYIYIPGIWSVVVVVVVVVRSFVSPVKLRSRALMMLLHTD